MERDGRSNICQSFITSIALAYNRASNQTRRVSNVTVRMLFDDDFERGRSHINSMYSLASGGKCNLLTLPRR